MQAIPGKVQSMRRSSGVENRKDSFNCFQQARTYPTPVIAFIEPFKTPMLKAPDHQDTT
jgi:hypothetical protein